MEGREKINKKGDVAINVATRAGDFAAVFAAAFTIWAPILTKQWEDRLVEVESQTKPLAIENIYTYHRDIIDSYKKNGWTVDVLKENGWKVAIDKINKEVAKEKMSDPELGPSEVLAKIYKYILKQGQDSSFPFVKEYSRKLNDVYNFEGPNYFSSDKSQTSFMSESTYCRLLALGGVFKQGKLIFPAHTIYEGGEKKIHAFDLVSSSLTINEHTRVISHSPNVFYIVAKYNRQGGSVGINSEQQIAEVARLEIYTALSPHGPRLKVERIDSTSLEFENLLLEAGLNK